MAGRTQRARQRFVIFGAILAVALAAGLLLDQVALRGVEAAAPVASKAASTSAKSPAPSAAQAAFDAGIGHLRGGDAHSAALAFERARQADPRAPAVLVNLAFSYLALDRPEASAGLFEQATAIAPSMTNAYFGMAEALDAMGDREGARGAMRTFLHLASEDDPFRRRAMAALWEWAPGPGLTESAAAVTEPFEAPIPEDIEAPTDGTAIEMAALPDPPAGQDASTVLSVPLETLDGDPATLADHSPRILVVNVWASWCAPCRAELPSLDRLAERLDPESFAVIGVSTDMERPFTREFVRETGVGFVNYWDGKGALTRDVLDVVALPLTVLIGPEGEVLLRHEGALDWASDEVATAIEALAPPGLSPDRVARLREVLQ